MKLGLAGSILLFVLCLTSRAADLTDADNQFLAGYEKVHAALAADNLPEAKTAALEMKEDGAPVASADSLIMARKGFATMSERALSLTKGRAGYFHVYCPMAKKDWVQTSSKISNPYEGKEMVTCGVIKP
ncbi:MAG: hypothetical protein M3Y86_02805 [Verrucomicrobiota bacterium]|nr:hypothetical protein [Verrucomicrobiota bacterium]